MTLTVGPGNTGAVRVVGTSPDEVLIVTPLPRRDRGTNKIDVVQVADSSADGGSVIQVVVNGEIDQVQPGIGDLAGIIVYGGNKAKNNIIIDPSVTVPATIDGGHGYKNHLTGGSGLTREHGWFGHSVLIGGSGPNELDRPGRPCQVQALQGDDSGLHRRAKATGLPISTRCHRAERFTNSDKGHLVVVVQRLSH